MKNFRFLAVVAALLFFGFSFGSTAMACSDPADKEIVSFNIGRRFFKVRLTKEKPRVEVDLNGIPETIELSPEDQTVELTYMVGEEQRGYSGKLYGVYRCQNTPQYVVWDQVSHRAEFFGVQNAEHFYFFATKDYEASKLYFIYNTTSFGYVRPDALALFKKYGKTVAGAIEVSLPGLPKTVIPIADKNFFLVDYLEIKEKDRPTRRYFTFDITGEGGGNRLLGLNLATGVLD